MTMLDLSEGERVLSRPWSARALELEARDGPWSDFGAWREWVAREEEMYGPETQPAPILDTLDYMQEIALYVLMCKLADGSERIA